jgi:hypothetical protein
MEEGNQISTELQDRFSEKNAENVKLTENGNLQSSASGNLLSYVDLKQIKTQKSEYSKVMDELEMEKQIRSIREKKRELEYNIDRIIADKTGSYISKIVEDTLTAQAGAMIKAAVDDLKDNINIEKLVVDMLENQFDNKIVNIDVLELNERLRLIESIASKFDDLNINDIDIGKFILDKIPKEDIISLPVENYSDEDGEEINWDCEIDRFGSIEGKVEDMDSRLFSIEEAITNYVADGNNSEIDNIKSKILAIEKKLNADKIPAEFKAMYARFYKCIAIGNSNMGKEPCELNLDHIEITRQLEQRGYFIDESKVFEIVCNLVQKRMIILEGAPGSGKTRLAKLLSEIVLRQSEHESYTLAPVDPEWTKYNCIGGLCKKGNHFGPYIGKLTDAVLKSIESNGRHWLILDEFNRGDIDAYLTSTLSGMPLDEGILEFDHAFPDKKEPAAKFRMPLNFRIICTMNSYDKNHLYKMPAAFNRRSGNIQINKPGAELERKFIDFKKKQFLSNIEKEGKIVNDEVILSIHNLIDFAAKKLSEIRGVAGDEPESIFEPCYVSMGTIINILNAFNFEIERSATTGKVFTDADISRINDAIFHTVYCQELLSNQPIVFQRLMEDVFPKTTFPKTYNRLEQKLRQVKLF